MDKRIVVVGGGAAGMMAALTARRLGADVTLLERNEKLGKKLYITGKGRCNLTNHAPRDEFMENIVRNPRFLYAAFGEMFNTELMDEVERMGVPVKIERGGRVFPESDRSSDILRAFECMLQLEGVQILFNTRVRSISQEQGRVAGVVLENGRIMPAERVILATGGMSYPATGSTGDGWRFAEETGHKVKPALPALVPIETVETWPSRLMGLSLKNVTLSATNRGKRLYSEQGEMLFTHFGISGPLALSLSSKLPEQPEGVSLLIDLKPALDEATLDRRLLRDFQAMSRKQLISVMDGLAPHSLAAVLLELAGISPALPVNSVTQGQRRTILELLKRLPLTVCSLRGMEEAIITRGGVAVSEINPSTMASKRLEGLYFAGELIDVDALTGGFNLQIAFSTGALAGKSAATL